MRLPKAQRVGFIDAITKTFEVLLERLCRIDVERADAFNPADKEMIFAAIRATVGFHELNVIATGALREALVGALTLGAAALPIHPLFFVFTFLYL